MEIRKLVEVSYYNDGTFDQIVEIVDGIIWRIDVQDCIEYCLDCIYVSDEYLRDTRDKIIKDKLNKWGSEHINRLLNRQDFGYFLAIDKGHVAYSWEKFYSSNNVKVINYKDWIVKKMVE